MMIGIDANEANIQNRVGSNEYAFQILQWIWKLQSASWRTKTPKLQKFKFKIYLKSPPLADLPKSTGWWQYQILKPKFLWTQWRLPLELMLNRGKLDVFFTPGHYAPRFCPTSLVMSIMDLAFLRFPRQFRKRDLYQLINWTKRSVQQADHILTISEFSKKEIIHSYNYPANKITVTYPGVKKLNAQNVKILEKYKIERNKYFLYIGTLQPRKNLIRLIKAFNILISQYPGNRLVIVGKKGWLYEEIFDQVKKLGLEDKVVFTGFVEEKEKQALLSQALALALPSLYEGFGLPVLEAMAVGCPVIVSHNSSLVEIVGEAGLYIDNPLSVPLIQKAMVKMVKLDSKQRQKLIKLGFQQIKKFSWLKAAEKTLSILKEVADVRH